MLDIPIPGIFALTKQINDMNYSLNDFKGLQISLIESYKLCTLVEKHSVSYTSSVYLNQFYVNMISDIKYNYNILVSQLGWETKSEKTIAIDIIKNRFDYSILF